MDNFFEHVRELLKRNERFSSKDGELLRNTVAEAAAKFDPELLRLLLDDEITREKFFVDIDGVKIFNAKNFAWLINNHQFLPDSYTRFKNKIGLTADDKPLAEINNVALVFPYKDCVLEGGQTRDDQRRTEIFYNTTLAQGDVDCLLAPKVFANATRYDADGSRPAEIFDADNLIVKGNNLLALASLEKVFRGKVKCIYIDPPYNTGNDGFNYNDKFPHSTWLVFMKNRLELAKKILADDGSIWISIDDDEGHYLKVLADEIFGRDNFVATVIWEKVYTTKNDARWLSDSHDFILVYAKNKNIWRPNLLPRTEEMNARYTNPDNDPRGVWKSNPLQAKSGTDSTFEHTFANGVKWTPPTGRFSAFSHETLDRLERDNRIYFGEDGNGVPRVKKFLTEVKQGVTTGTIFYREAVGDNHEAKSEMRNLGMIFSSPKPERLLERILTLATNAGDLVMDFFVGSGTTAAVAHKMGRRYIGVEQMDYIQTLTVARLQKVIGGERGGISERVGWTGGGSFVYCELAALNQKFVDAIERAKADDLPELCREIAASKFISHKVKPADIALDDFAALSIDDQKLFLLELLDKNLLYVNLSDIDDVDFAISDADKKFTRSFYGEG